MYYSSVCAALSQVKFGVLLLRREGRLDIDSATNTVCYRCSEKES